MEIKNRIKEIQNKMSEKNISAYLVTTGDYHQSEYIGDYFKTRVYMSGFTGSAGNLVIFKDEACLWTDGRYHVQAEKELEGSGIKLFKDGNLGVPTFVEYLAEKLNENDILACDAKLVATNVIKVILAQKKYEILDIDLISALWNDRSELPKNKMFLLEEKHHGLAYAKKLKQVHKIMEEKGAEFNILTSLDDIAWLYNFRGSDIESNPVVLSFAIINKENSTLYVDKDKLDEKALAYFKENSVTVKDYFEVFEDVKNIDAAVLIEEAKVSYGIYNNLAKDIKIIQGINPTTYIKCHKNPVEVANTKAAHIDDGVAVTKFMYWIKNNFDKLDIDEYEAGIYMDNLRKEVPDYIDYSFNTIAAFGPNAAMMHYKAAKDKCSKISKGTFLLDSGGQYLRGTTDITRTFFLGEVDEEIKRHNTLVLKGMLALTRAKFLFGATGTNLDILARQFVWANGIDYKCGTGHGVGHILNVHEGPHGIRMQYNSQKFEENMIVTNEPGVYIKDSHGIRIENELLVKTWCETEHGKFMHFENLTFVPIDLDGIVVDMLTPEEKDQLNAYHKEVYEKLAPKLDTEILSFLKEYTRAI